MNKELLTKDCTDSKLKTGNEKKARGIALFNFAFSMHHFPGFRVRMSNKDYLCPCKR